MNRCQRSPRDWFAEAERCYIEHHQGCAWCDESYCVYHSARAQHREYCCNSCDFRAGFDAANNRFFSYPGEDPANQVTKMYDI
jgi:hypothetical protein